MRAARMMGVVMALALAGTGVAAKQPLREVRTIDDGLLAVGIADEIRKQCPTISARMLTALSYMKSLENKARALGYSKSEIKAYTRSKAEKARMRARGEAYLRANGVQMNQPETFCALGRAEIAKSSQIGALLRAK